MNMLWVIFLVGLLGSELGHGYPVGSTPQTYLHGGGESKALEEWRSGSSAFAVVSGVALVLAAAGLLFGCTWCYRHKDCKLFTASAAHLQDARRSNPPDSGFESVNNNISEDNNNGPISLREMQNIANNNATAYIVSENEERNRVSRESVVEFEPLPTGIRVTDPLERCADWFAGEDLQRNRLQYLREIGRGWFGRVVEGEVEDGGASSAVAVKILNQNASLEDKARFLDEARMYRDLSHENILRFVTKCLQADPWLLVFEFCSMDLNQYLTVNRPKMAILNENGVPLQLMCDTAAALSYLHARGYLYGSLWSGNVLVRGGAESPRAVVGQYALTEPQHECVAPEERRQPPLHSAQSEVWSLGALVWEVCAWGARPPPAPPLPDLPCPYRSHLYQVMQLCWNPNPAGRPTAAQAHALLSHLHGSHSRCSDATRDGADFEQRWQRLKPNSIPVIDEHVAMVHAPSTSMTSHFTGSDQEMQTIQDSLSVDMDTAVSRSSSIMSDKDPLSIQIKSESLTNLHGSLEDVRNIYLTHNETAVLECHQANIIMEDRDDNDKSDSSVDPWLKDIIAGSQDDVSYYKDVSDVIKNLDNMLNSEKTSSSESSHQASPSRDNLSLDCKKEVPLQSNMVKSPGISNFQNVLETTLDDDTQVEPCDENDVDRDTIGTLSHSFERHSDTTSQQTLENLTPDTPIKDVDIPTIVESHLEPNDIVEDNIILCNDKVELIEQVDLPKETKVESSDSKLLMLKELCLASIPSVSVSYKCKESEILKESEDFRTSCDNLKDTTMTDNKENDAKSIDVTIEKSEVIPQLELNYNKAMQKSDAVEQYKENVEDPILPKILNDMDTYENNHYPSIRILNSTGDNETSRLIQIEGKEISKSECIDTNIKNECVSPPNVIFLKNITYEKDGSEVMSNSDLKTSLKVINEDEISISIEPPSVIVPNINDLKTTDRMHMSATDTSVEITCTGDMSQFSDNNMDVKEEVTMGMKDILKDTRTETAINKDVIAELNNEEKGIHKKKYSDKHEIDIDTLTIFIEQEKLSSSIEKVNFSKGKSTSLENETQGVTEIVESLTKNIIPVEKVGADAVPTQIENNLEERFNLNSVPAETNAAVKGPVQVENSVKNEIELNIIPVETEVAVAVPTQVENNVEESFYLNIIPAETVDAVAGPVQVENSLKKGIDLNINPVATEVAIAIPIHVENNMKEGLQLNNFTNHEPVENIYLIEAATLPQEEIETSDAKNHNLSNISGENDISISRSISENNIILNKNNLDLLNTQTETPESVQIIVDKNELAREPPLDITENILISPIVPEFTPEIVQNTVKEETTSIQNVEERIPIDEELLNKKETKLRSDSYNAAILSDYTIDSTIYMDLTTNTKNDVFNHTKINLDLANSYADPTLANVSISRNESTVYLDPPDIIKATYVFLQTEKAIVSQNINSDSIATSTPKTSDYSLEMNQEKLKNENETLEAKIPEYSNEDLTKVETKHGHDTATPPESPTKSLQTDTYDENSSVVLGSLENYQLDMFKNQKPTEELFAFSSNFSEVDLETPSPLRDVNFLNEVPDIVPEDLQFDDIETISEIQPEVLTEPKTEDTDETDKSGTEKRVSPSTPPNSPGNFFALVTQQKYLVDIDLNPPADVDMPQTSHAQHEIDYNQIDLQMTTKLAMAENENNMNIEYAGPLTVEGFSENVVVHEPDDLPEAYLAGNGDPQENFRGFSLDEESVKALRNELELKLPLAQVASIEPQCEGEGWTELPPPPELILSYPGALSPIAEETGNQLTAYENDLNWYPSCRTDSSESYPEPCNNSTDEVTDLPTGAPSAPHDPSTYTLHSNHNSNTYTVHKDLLSSKELTMSADSLNGSPLKKRSDTESSPNDATYTKDDIESNLERLSRVSPYLVSPTTDTSAVNSDTAENVTGVSTLSKTTQATDAKHSKPSETQCLSKATSIDSWCSNDTLYNVEENFDDLALDPDVPLEANDDDSETSHTLTHNEDEKDLSHCSTYIIHDSKSEPCETFSPDSITANDNYTYTKVKTTEVSPSAKSDVNDSTKTKDLAYGTLMSGLPSYSNCTTEVASGIDDCWKLQQPELVRRSPIGNEVHLTPPKLINESDCELDSPQLLINSELKKMDSVEIECLNDNTSEVTKVQNSPAGVNDNSNYHYRNMAQSVTSTPCVEVDEGNQDVEVEQIQLDLPIVNMDNSESLLPAVPSFQAFVQSAELRHQDLSSDNSKESSKINTEILLEGDTVSKDSNKDSVFVSQHSTNYTGLGASNENPTLSMEFSQFENSARNRPQDLSSLIDASSLLLRSERISSEWPMRTDAQSSQSSISNVPSVDISKPSANPSCDVAEVDEILQNIHVDEETEQPHSIIVTESPKDRANVTYDSHTNYSDVKYDSHLKKLVTLENVPTLNGVEHEQPATKGTLSPLETTEQLIDTFHTPSDESILALFNHSDFPNGSTTSKDVKCNGKSENFATVNFLSEFFEELFESNVDDGDKDLTIDTKERSEEKASEVLEPVKDDVNGILKTVDYQQNKPTPAEVNGEQDKLVSATEDFLLNEKKFCQIDHYLPLLNDIRFTGPASEIMSTSFRQESPTEPAEPAPPDSAADILKDWDSDTDSHSSNSSSGEFIWKGGDGHETPVPANTHFQHQRENKNGGGGEGAAGDAAGEAAEARSEGSRGPASDGSGESGSEGEEVEFVPSSWDCRAAPAKSSLRSLETTPDSKKRVVFKRQKYHCVYEYPREVVDADTDSPASYMPDFSTYTEWDPTNAEDAELGYGQLFGAPDALDMYPLRSNFSFSTDYDEDFFISSSARPFESSLGLMTTSQFFPGMHMKPSLLDAARDPEPAELPPPSPLPAPPLTAVLPPAPTLLQTLTPSLDFTTPDSGVEDITPGSTEEEFKTKKLESECWRPADSCSSSESVSPSSPGGEALGGLRHTRDKLKLDLPPSPHLPSPRHNRVFNFVLDKPKRHRHPEEKPAATPLVMTDETPVVTTALPLQDEELPAPEPTFSTFGKCAAKAGSEQKIVFTDEAEEKPETTEESHVKVEAVKGEGTVLDSGDEDSGIESSSKATLERKEPAPNVS